MFLRQEKDGQIRCTWPRFFSLSIFLLNSVFKLSRFLQVILLKQSKRFQTTKQRENWRVMAVATGGTGQWHPAAQTSPSWFFYFLFPPFILTKIPSQWLPFNNPDEAVGMLRNRLPYQTKKDEEDEKMSTLTDLVDAGRGNLLHHLSIRKGMFPSVALSTWTTNGRFYSDQFQHCLCFTTGLLSIWGDQRVIISKTHRDRIMLLGPLPKWRWR